MSDYAKYVGGENGSRVGGSFNKGATYAHVLTAALGGFYFGYVMSYFNIVLKFVQEVAYSEPVENSMTNWITSLVPLGAAVGALLTGKIAAVFGRKKTMIFIDILGLIGTGITLLPSPWALLFGRLIQGYSVGSNSSIVPLYISEIAPSEAAGTMGTCNQLFISTGVLIAPIIGLAMPTEDEFYAHADTPVFRIVLACAAVPIIIRLLLTFFVLNMETPSYLVSVGKDDEALEILNKLYDTTRAQDELATLKREQAAQAQAGQLTMKDVFSARYKKRVIVGCLIAIFQQFSGINAIIFFSTIIFTGSGSKPIVYTIIMDVLQVVSTLTAGLVIERFGRKVLFSGGMAVVSVLLIVFGIIYVIVHDSPVLKFLIWGYMIAFGLSVGPIPWIYISDILPDIAVGVAVQANWISAFIIGLTFQPIINAIGLEWGFFIFGICSVVGTVFGQVVMKETKGKSKAEIEEMFSQNSYNDGEITSSLRA